MGLLDRGRNSWLEFIAARDTNKTQWESDIQKGEGKKKPHGKMWINRSINLNYKRQ